MKMSMRALVHTSMLLAICGAGLVSCSFFDTTVVRDLRGIWSPSGKSVLVIQSQYKTPNPGQPYHYAPAAHSWKLFFYTASPPETLDTTNSSWLNQDRTLLAERDEVYSQGGVPQYEPAYWYPSEENPLADGNLAVLGGRSAQVLYLDTGSSWEPRCTKAQLESALRQSSDNGETYGLDPSYVAAYLEVCDLIPSADSRYVALVYRTSFLTSTFGSSMEFRVIACFDRQNRTLLGLSRVSPWLWSISRPLSPYYFLTTDAPDYVWASWAPDTSGLYVPLRADYSPDEDASLEPITPNEIRFVSLTGGLAQVVTSAPAGLLATASGPVSPGGYGISMVMDGNSTQLELTSAPSTWQPFKEQALVGIDTTWWLNATSLNL